MTRNPGPGFLLLLAALVGGAGCTSKDALLSRNDGAIAPGTGGIPVSATGGVTAIGGAGAGQAGNGGTGSGSSAGVNGGGGVVGPGGQSQGGSVGLGGGGLTGSGSSACRAVDALSRSCVTDADCAIGAHQSNCCGVTHYVGISAKEASQFAALEPSCKASYPLCGCPTTAPVMDDGSTDVRGFQPNFLPAVTCLAGTCTTYVADCGKPCEEGTTCFTCLIAGGQFAACTTTCKNTTTSADCATASLPLCQTGMSGNVAGMYCTAAGVVCDRK